MPQNPVLEAVLARIPFRDAITHSYSTIALALTAHIHSADELVALILAYPGKHGASDADAWFRSEHTLPQTWLNNFILTGKDLTEGPWGPDGWATKLYGPGVPPPTPRGRLVNIDDAFVELASISPFIPYEVNRALERVAARTPEPEPGPVEPEPVQDLKPTDDPATILARALMPSAYTHAGNRTIEAGTADGDALREQRSAALEAFKLTKGAKGIDADVLTVLFLTGADGAFTLSDFKGKTFAEFVVVLKTGGAPSGIEE